MVKKFSIGIDLGTSNSVIALCIIGEEGLEPPRVEVVPITQLSGPGQITTKSLLPSAMYIAPDSERGEGNFDLPWAEGANRSFVIGSYARERGALVPDRLITSAKSWLCNSSVDRRAPILPWRSETVEKHYSPYEATRLYLEHLKDTLLHHFKSQGIDASIDDCEIVVTVPASFDEVARTLTHQAAVEAGLGAVTLLEEPQAAFYDWLSRKGRHWSKTASPGDVILVCDLGGGTADFTLIGVTETGGSLELSRISVGDHILLGGDNMDLALAFAVRAALEEEGKGLDAWQFNSLVHLVRSAKETILSTRTVDEVPISIPSRGSNLFAAPIAFTITRELVNSTVVNGFLPLVTHKEFPSERRSFGLKELGLSYAQDPAITKHLARFLTQSLSRVKADPSLASHLGTEDGTFLRPSAILFNGGVLNSEFIRSRIIELLSEWNGGKEVRELEGNDRDLSVARGAATYAHKKATGEGFKIRSGTVRSYYIGLESSMPAVPGFTPPVKGLCVVPRGLEEGSELVIPDAEFGLVTGQEVDFRFFSSADRPADKIGAIIDDAERELEETSYLSVSLPSREGAEGGELVPVELHVNINELGLMELWMKDTSSDNRWKLEFNVRAIEG